MLTKLIAATLLLMCLSDATSKSLSQNVHNNDIGSTHFFGKAPYPSWKIRQANGRTTQRPFIRYWNNFVRNVRLSIPTVTWNMTNPFTNLFDAGELDLVERPTKQPYLDDDELLYEDNQYIENTGNKQKRKNQKKRKNSTKRDKHRRRRPQHHGDAEWESYNDNSDYSGNNEEPLQRPQPYLLKPYDSGPANKPVYLYDPRSEQYYELQSVRAQAADGQSNHYHETEGNQSIAEETASTATMEDNVPPVMYSHVEDSAVALAPQLAQEDSMQIEDTQTQAVLEDARDLILLRPIKVKKQETAEVVVDTAADALSNKADSYAVGLPHDSKEMAIGRTRNIEAVVGVADEGKTDGKNSLKTMLYYFIPTSL